MKDKKKVLLLAGKPIGSVEIVEELKRRGHYVIVADYLPPEESPAKRIADEAWNVSTADVELLVERCVEAKIDAVVTGVHEFNINRMLDLTERLGLPCYCRRDTWIYCDNKSRFKQLCCDNDIPVARVYDIEEIRNGAEPAYPVIVKPVDGSGSRGFHICRDRAELETYHADAASFSTTSTVLIEEFVPYNAVIIHYTIIQGKAYYSGISDKISVRFANTGASVMGIQTFPSKGEERYLALVDEKARRMFETAGFTDGPVWIEAFYDGVDRFIFNEMGYRFGGSLTYYPVRYFHNFDQLGMMIDQALGDHVAMPAPLRMSKPDLNYCILPVHIRAGRIEKVEESETLRTEGRIYAVVPVHFEGDTILDWGSAQQVYAYVHILFSDKTDLIARVNALFDNLKVLDSDGNNMIYTLFDINTIELK